VKKGLLNERVFFFAPFNRHFQSQKTVYHLMLGRYALFLVVGLSTLRPKPSIKTTGMLRTIAILFILTFPFTSFANEFYYHRDYQSILTKTQDSTSSLYYPALLERFNRNDKKLTNREVLALQIGFTQNKYYRPYGLVTKETNIQKLVNQKKYEDALKVCNDILSTNPLNFTALMEKSYIYKKLEMDSADFHRHKFLAIVRSIEYSGTGSREEPYFVLGPADGQLLIMYIWGGSIGVMGSSHDQNGYFLDILEMKKRGKKAVNLHFIVDHATKTMFNFNSEELKKLGE
jgi:hypothetical protein